MKIVISPTSSNIDISSNFQQKQVTQFNNTDKAHHLLGFEKKQNHQSFSSQVSSEKLRTIKGLTDNQSSRRDNSFKLGGDQSLYTPNQVKQMLQQEQNQKLQLLNNNYLLQKKQVLESFKSNNGMKPPVTARHTEYSHPQRLAHNYDADFGQNNQTRSIQENQKQIQNNKGNSRNQHLHIQDASHDDGDHFSSIQTALKTVTIDSSEMQYNPRREQSRSKTRTSDQHHPQKKEISSTQYGTLNSAYNSQVPKSARHHTQNYQTQPKSISHVNQQPGLSNTINGDEQKQQTKKSNLKNPVQRSNTNQFTPTEDSAQNFNPSTATYHQSLVFYESQYKEKLKELEVERKAKRRLEDRIDEVESGFAEMIEENHKLKEQLDELKNDNQQLSQYYQVIQEQQKANEPYTTEIEQKNIQLNLDIFTLREEMKNLNDEKAQQARKNSQLQQQLDEVAKENRKWKEQLDQLKERMQSIRQVNKQLENKANQNWVMLRRNDLFKEYEDRMNKAEARVKELEESLEQFIEDFETLNNDLSICAQKLALAEGRVELLNKKNSELETQNSELLQKIAKIRKPPPKTVNLNLCAHYENQKGFNPEEMMKVLETQNMQILTLTQTLETQRKENREYFQKTLEQQETIFNLQNKVQDFENFAIIRDSNPLSMGYYSHRDQLVQSLSQKKQRQSEDDDYQQNQQQFPRLDFTKSDSIREEGKPTRNYSRPAAKHFSLSSSQDQQKQKATMDIKISQDTFGIGPRKLMGEGSQYTTSSVNEYEGADNEILSIKGGNNTVRSGAKEFSFKNAMRDYDPTKVLFKTKNTPKVKSSAVKSRQSQQLTQNNSTSKSSNKKQN